MTIKTDYKFEVVGPGDRDPEILELWRRSRDPRWTTWQDRSPNPFALYEGWGPINPLIFCAYDHDRLVATSVLVSYGSYSKEVGRELQFVYDTDLFVDHEHAGGGLVFRLLDFRNAYLKSTHIFDLSKTAFIAVAHRPGLFEAITRRFHRRTDDWDLLLGTSDLIEFSTAPTSFVGNGDLQFSSDPRRFGLPSSRGKIVPVGEWSLGRVAALEKMSGKMWFYQSQKNAQSGYLCDLGKVRKLRWTPSGARFGANLKADDELHYLIGSHFEGDLCSSIDEACDMIESLLQFSHTEGYAFVALRDLTEDVLRRLKERNRKFSKYSRSVFVWGARSSATALRDPVQEIIREGLKIESLFL